MMPNPATSRPTIADLVGRDGFAFVHDAEMRGVLEANGLAEWDRFAASWDDLGLDTYMADGGRYRRRRHAVFAATPGRHRPAGAPPALPEPRLQRAERRRRPLVRPGDRRRRRHARLHGHPAHLPARVRHALAGCPAWEVEVHQFRIEAQPGQAGQPTPEGMHRDGVDWVLVLLVRRENIASGETTIHDLEKRLLGSFTLARPMDAAWVDDSRVYHGVTPVEPRDPTLPAFRDVLVVTFRRSANG